MKASSKITVVLGDCKEQYNDALENLHRAMKAIPPHDLSTVTVMLSVVMEGFALLGRVDFLLGFNKNPKDYANCSTIQWHRVSVYPQKLGDLVTEHVVPTLRFIYYHSVDLKGENEYLGLGVSLGNVPMYHGTKLKVLDRKVRITELMLKCVSRSLRVVAIVLMVIDSQVKEFFSFQKKAKLTDMKALV
ncbi:hypothetical protein JHK87_006030 [Glycine soja]|nr:hypothetical protein JHK87_006030 [Glycine soja]